MAMHSLFGNKRGATLMEFAMVAPPLILTLMGIFDLGHRTYLNSVLYGAMQKAGRDSSLETGAAQLIAIDNKVRDSVSPVLLGSTFQPMIRRATKSFTAVQSGEPFTDGNANGLRDAGECFDDENSNGAWDSSAGANGLGASDDVITYKARITFSHVFPMPGLLGWPANDTLTATTVLRNQPYGERSEPARICT